MKRLLATTLFVLILASLVLLLTSSAFAGKKPPVPPPGPGGCICPDIYAPVICSDGVTYSNACVASCAKATGCVPANTM